MRKIVIAFLLISVFMLTTIVSYADTQTAWNSTKKSITLSTGITLKYVELGNSKGKNLVLLHGITDTSRSWSLTIPYLTKKYHLYILDQRGFGDTSKPAARTYPVALYAEDVNAFLDQLHIDKATIVGHSLGSYIARSFAINYPEKTENLILLSTNTTLVNTPAATSLWELVNGLKSSPVDPQIVNDLDSTAIPVNNEFINLVKTEAANLPVSVWKASFRGLLTEDHSAFLKEIKAPTLVLWGDKDSLFSADDETKLQEVFPNAKYVTIANAGHNIQWEQPEKVATLIKDFIK